MIEFMWSVLIISFIVFLISIIAGASDIFVGIMFTVFVVSLVVKLVQMIL